jgi:hypothetical protein
MPPARPAPALHAYAPRREHLPPCRDEHRLPDREISMPWPDRASILHRFVAADIDRPGAGEAVRLAPTSTGEPRCLRRQPQLSSLPDGSGQKNKTKIRTYIDILGKSDIVRRSNKDIGP